MDNQSRNNVNLNNICFNTGQIYMFGSILLFLLGGLSILAVSFGAFSGRGSVIFLLSAGILLLLLLALLLSRVKTVTLDTNNRSVAIRKLVPLLGRTRSYGFNEINEVCFVVDYGGVMRTPVDTHIKLNLEDGGQVALWTNRDGLPKGFKAQGAGYVDVPLAFCKEIAKSAGVPILKRTCNAGQRVRGSVNDEYIYPEGTEASRAEDFNKHLE